MLTHFLQAANFLRSWKCNHSQCSCWVFVPRYDAGRRIFGGFAFRRFVHNGSGLLLLPYLISYSMSNRREAISLQN
jgi:hypothetical protein